MTSICRFGWQEASAVSITVRA